jgi:hypothetical protein
MIRRMRGMPDEPPAGASPETADRTAPVFFEDDEPTTLEIERAQPPTRPEEPVTVTRRDSPEPAVREDALVTAEDEEASGAPKPEGEQTTDGESTADGIKRSV